MLHARREAPFSSAAGIRGPKDNGSLFEATIGVCFNPNRSRGSGC